MKEITLPFLVKLAFVLICILALGYLAFLGKFILAPLFFAFLMAILMMPLASFLERKWKFNRTLSTLTSMLLMAIVLTGLFYFFGSQLSDFTNDFPVLQKQVSKSLLQLQVWVSKTFHVNIVKQWEYINQGLEKLFSSTGVILGFTVSMFSSSLAFVAFSALFFIFILKYRRLLYEFFISVFTEKHSYKVHEVMAEIQRIIKSYIFGLFIQFVIVSTLTCILLSVLHVKYAILLGVLTGLMNLIPYIGIFISCLIACLISFATGGSATLFVLLGYVGIHAIDGNLILPFVVGSKVKINALFTFLGLLVGEALWGISGMFLSIPLLAILKIIFEKVQGLEPWGKLLGEEKKINRKQRKFRISKKYTIQEKD